MQSQAGPSDARKGASDAPGAGVSPTDAVLVCDREHSADLQAWPRQTGSIRILR